MSSENVIKIADHINELLKDFRSSGKPQWSMPLKVMNANRYAISWHENQRILAQMEYSCKKAQEIPDKDSLKVPF